MKGPERQIQNKVREWSGQVRTGHESWGTWRDETTTAAARIDINKKSRHGLIKSS